MKAESAPDRKEQVELLRALTAGGGYGMLFIVTPTGDVPFAASPVPKLRGYEIVCASSNRLYDIWHVGQLVKPDQTAKQIKAWIRKRTPKWLMDDSEPTDSQKFQVCIWAEEFRERHPGPITAAKR